ncbi:MAG: hypothetical protein ACJ79M_05860 [Myxococcales bacterium]
MPLVVTVGEPTAVPQKCAARCDVLPHGAAHGEPQLARATAADSKLKLAADADVDDA